MKLHERFYDKEERVRLEVVKAVCDVAAENFEVVRKEVRVMENACACIHHLSLCMYVCCIISFVMTWKDE